MSTKEELLDAVEIVIEDRGIARKDIEPSSDFINRARQGKRDTLPDQFPAILHELKLKDTDALIAEAEAVRKANSLLSNKNFGEAVRAVRNNKGLSQKGLRIGEENINHQAISHVENNYRRSYPGSNAIIKILRALGCRDVIEIEGKQVERNSLFRLREELFEIARATGWTPGSSADPMPEPVVKAGTVVSKNVSQNASSTPRKLEWHDLDVPARLESASQSDRTLRQKIEMIQPGAEDYFRQPKIGLIGVRRTAEGVAQVFANEGDFAAITRILSDMPARAEATAAVNGKYSR